MALNLVGNYSLGAVIGQGSSAVVHQAWQRETGAFVAIKKFERSSNDIKAVLTELDLLSKLDHPNIVKYLGAINDSEGLHVVLEYMENGSLASVRKLFGDFSEPVCSSYVNQVLFGLEYLHAQGVLHRDIKGANILTPKLVWQK
jgi:serine/threonine protein kinase